MKRRLNAVMTPFLEVGRGSTYLEAKMNTQANQVHSCDSDVTKQFEDWDLTESIEVLSGQIMKVQISYELSSTKI